MCIERTMDAGAHELAYSQVQIAGKMKYLKNIYADEKSKKTLTKKRLISLKEKKLYKLPLICIYIPANGERPEFTEISNLNYPYFHRNEPVVIGFAESERPAIAIVKRFIKDVFLEDANLGYRDYVESVGLNEEFTKNQNYVLISSDEINEEFDEMLPQEEADELEREARKEARKEERKARKEEKKAKPAKET